MSDGDDSLSSLRSCCKGSNAERQLSVLLRVQRMWTHPEAEVRRLLCVLLLFGCSMPVSRSRMRLGCYREEIRLIAIS
jgi:hypothetical protein